jgi:hypothetical protein
MAAFTYSPLNNPRSQIRLLDLQPGQRGDVLTSLYEKHACPTIHPMKPCLIPGVLRAHLTTSESMVCILQYDRIYFNV